MNVLKRVLYAAAGVDLAMLFMSIDSHIRRDGRQAASPGAEGGIPGYYIVIELILGLMLSLLILYFERKQPARDAKSEFFANIVHELKTPLSVILGAIQLMDHMKSEKFEERRKSGRHIQTIRQNSYRILRLVNNILDITRMESGYMTVSMQNIDIVSLLGEITDSVKPYAEQKSITLQFDTGIDEAVMAVDVGKMERIFLNLLSNAIKFTQAGGSIWVKLMKTNGDNPDAARDNKPDGGGCISISVKDTGPGIPEEMRSVIFERFRQANGVLTKESEGSGLGLAIVRSFVELHHGGIKVASSEGEGSEFIVELPVTSVENGKTQAVQDQDRTESRSRIIQAINIELADIYGTVAVKQAKRGL